MIPKYSAPLTKLIRTLEGLIWLAANIALVVAPIVSQSVSPADSIQWGAIMNSVMFVARTALKALALGKPLGLPAPAQFLSSSTLTNVSGVLGQVAGNLASDVSKGATVDEVLAQIDAAEQAAAVLQSKPGIPADKVSAGLSPDPAGAVPNVPEPGPAVKP
jgi:hypothetical protein